MSNPYWLTISAMGSLPVLLLPDTRREVVVLLEQYLRKGEVMVKTRQLRELQEALELLQVSMGYQVNYPKLINI